ncbi:MULTISPECIES: serine protease, partial [unclassified Frankia]|uniref:serine protease n=1 Tax=unclassified Frankia TaxID=2632575 RepID=UPI002AD2CBD8
PAGRVVAVRARLSADEVSVGSGLLVTGRLVLTAAHVVAEADGRLLDAVSVRLSGSQRWWDARLVWSDPAAAVDAALVEICGSGWVPPVLPAVRWGRLTGQAGDVSAEAQGFPRSLRDGDERVREHVTGHVNPGVDEGARRYDLIVGEFPAEPPPGEASPWSGMSGAGLFAGGLLIGVLIVRTGRFAERRLRATPVHVLAADPGFCGWCVDGSAGGGVGGAGRAVHTRDRGMGAVAGAAVASGPGCRGVLWPDR